MANSEEKFKSLNYFQSYSRSDGLFNFLRLAFQSILNVGCLLTVHGNTCTATEEHRVSTQLERACRFLAAFTGTWSYLSLRNTQTALRPLETCTITARHAHAHVVRHSEHAAATWQRRGARRRAGGAVLWGAEAPQDRPHSGTPALRRSRSYITDRSSTTERIRSVHKSDCSWTNYNGKNGTFSGSGAGQPRGSGSRK